MAYYMAVSIHSRTRPGKERHTYESQCTTFGPIMGPWISGFVAVVSWRWCFWIGLIYAGATLPLVIFMPETYGPVILTTRAKRLRKETGNSNIVSPLELESRDIRRMFLITISRPFRMIFHESIVSLTSLYLALAYAIFYLYFEAYPIIFQGMCIFLGDRRSHIMRHVLT